MTPSGPWSILSSIFPSLSGFRRAPTCVAPSLATALLLASPVWAQETTLGYDAFVGSAKVGEAQVKIHKDEARYAITARPGPIGVLQPRCTQWQSLFTATGTIWRTSGPVTDGYRFIESARDKIRESPFSDGSPDVPQEWRKCGQAARADQRRPVVCAVRIPRLPPPAPLYTMVRISFR